MEDLVKKNRKKLEENQRQITVNTSSEHKQKLSQVKNLNKRQNPFGIPLAAKFFLPDTQKRSRLDNMRFLLGGNISDPLNLCSLQNESDVDSLSTLESRRDRVEVIIPPNIHDPLHLLNPVDSQEYEKQLSNAFKKKRQRKRNKSTSDYHIKTRKQSYKGSLTTSTPIKNKDKDDDSSDANLSKDENASDDAQSPVKRKKVEKDKESLQLDKIVSPVVPSAGWKKPGKSMHRLLSSVEDPMTLQSDKPLEPDTELKTSGEIPSTSSTASPSLVIAEPQQGFVKREEFQKEVKFQHGNYNRYFGCGSLNQNIDVRLKVLQDHSHLFANKDVLDIGCNVGLLTIALAQHFLPKSIVGIDIDRKLIDIAENKLQKFVKMPAQPGSGGMGSIRRGDCFPTSFAINYGNMGALLKKVQKIGVQTPSKGSTPRNNDPSVGFPDNITFETMDYVPKDESRLNKDAEKYDLILCLSVTKWIHLNYGDAGLRLTFKRIFRQLRPGGKLILEAQNWASYKKKKKISSKIFENYKSIEFYPKLFSDYLLSPEVGFSHSLILGAPQHLSKGFKRPIELFVKGDFTPNQATKWSDAYNPQTPFELRSSVYSEFMFSNKYAPCMRRPSNYSLASPFTPYLTSPYYQPAPSSSYTPSYDNENTRNHVFMSPIYLSPGRSRRSVEASPNNEPNRSPASHLYHIYTSNSPNPSPKRDQT